MPRLKSPCGITTKAQPEGSSIRLFARMPHHDRDMPGGHGLANDPDMRGLTAIPSSPGRYTAESIHFSMPGAWLVEIQMQQEGRCNGPTLPLWWTSSGRGRWSVIMQNLPSLSLLWPDGIRPAQTCTALDPQCVRDLELEATLAAFTDSRLGRSSIREVFLHLCTDPAVIAYRQDILDDVWRNPDFTAHLEALLPDLHALDTAYIAVDRRRASLQDITWRLGELEHLVSCVTGWSTVFAQVGDKVHAKGWCAPRPHCADSARCRPISSSPASCRTCCGPCVQGQCDHRGESGWPAPTGGGDLVVGE